MRPSWTVLKGILLIQKTATMILSLTGSIVICTRASRRLGGLGLIRPSATAGWSGTIYPFFTYLNKINFSDCESPTYDEFFAEVLNCHDKINWWEYRAVNGEIQPTEFKRFLIKHHYADKYANEYSITHSAASGWKQPLFGFWDRRSSHRHGEPGFLVFK